MKLTGNLLFCYCNKINLSSRQRRKSAATALHSNNFLTCKMTFNNIHANAQSEAIIHWWEMCSTVKGNSKYSWELEGLASRPTVLSCKHMGRLGQASAMPRGLCKNTVLLLGLGLVLVLIKKWQLLKCLWSVWKFFPKFPRWCVILMARSTQQYSRKRAVTEHRAENAGTSPESLTHWEQRVQVSQGEPGYLAMHLATYLHTHISPTGENSRLELPANEKSHPSVSQPSG